MLNSRTYARVPIGSLQPLPGYMRRHSADKRSTLKKALCKFGQVIPILVDNGDRVVDGVLTLQLLAELGTEEVAILRLSDVSAEDIALLRISLAKMASTASWDDAALAAELGWLRTAGSDLGLSGLTTAELARLLDPPPDAAPTPDSATNSVTPIAAPCDVWLLGTQKLVIADSGCLTADEASSVSAVLWTGEPLVPSRRLRQGEAVDAAVLATLLGTAGRFEFAASLIVIGDWASALTTSTAVSPIWAATDADVLLETGTFILAQRFARHHFDGAPVAPATSSVWKTRKSHAERIVRTFTARNDTFVDLEVCGVAVWLAAHRLGRTCIGFQSSPERGDQLLRAWRAATGVEPVHSGSRKTLATLEAENPTREALYG